MRSHRWSGVGGGGGGGECVLINDEVAWPMLMIKRLSRVEVDVSPPPQMDDEMSLTFMVKRANMLDCDTGFNQVSDSLTGIMHKIKWLGPLDPDTGFNQATGDYLPLD